MVRQGKIKTTPLQREILWSLAVSADDSVSNIATAVWRRMKPDSSEYIAEFQRSVGVLRRHGALYLSVAEQVRPDPGWNEADDLCFERLFEFDATSRSWQQTDLGPGTLRLQMTRGGVDIMHLVAQQGERELPEGFREEPTWHGTSISAEQGAAADAGHLRDLASGKHRVRGSRG